MEQRTLKIGDRVVYCYEDGSVEYLSIARQHKKHPLQRTFGMTDRHGYKSIKLKVDGKIHNFRVHRLITMAFHPNPSNLPEVDHINRNKEDNRPCNLRWCTRKENNNNKDYIDRSIAKYGVRYCDDQKAYRKVYNKNHNQQCLAMRKPDGSNTMTGALTLEAYDMLKPLTMRDRYLKYQDIKTSHCTI